MLISGEGPREGANVRSLQSEEKHERYDAGQETRHLEVAVGPSSSGFPSFILIKYEFNRYETSMAPSPKVMKLVTDRQETTVMSAPLSVNKQCLGVTERVNSMEEAIVELDCK